jgi:hypothetical protein
MFPLLFGLLVGHGLKVTTRVKTFQRLFFPDVSSDRRNTTNYRPNLFFKCAGLWHLNQKQTKLMISQKKSFLFLSHPHFFLSINLPQRKKNLPGGRGPIICLLRIQGGQMRRRKKIVQNLAEPVC